MFYHNIIRPTPNTELWAQSQYRISSSPLPSFIYQIKGRGGYGHINSPKTIYLFHALS